MSECRSSKAELSPEYSFEAQQAFFDRFLQTYNEERLHEGAKRKMPKECYQPHESVDFVPYADCIQYIYYCFHLPGIFDAREN